MICTHCHKDFDDDLNFCPYCGQIKETIVKVCQKCGNELAPDHQFCGRCGSSLIRTEIKNAVADVEGNIFDAVKIGNQVWMAQNMAVTVDNNGNKLVLGEDYFYPNGDESLVEEYGLLYTWYAAMRIAPKGWHLPTNEEWDELEEYVGSQKEYRCDDNPYYIAKALASTTGWKEDDDDFTVGNDQSKNNATGFNAVPAGGYFSYGYFSYGCYTFGNSALFWGATQRGSYYANLRHLDHTYAYVRRGNVSSEYYGYSVRCLRD